MLSQELQILRDLNRGKRITPLDALKNYGCFRLGARIWDIEQRGYTVSRKIVSRNGKRFAEYWLPKIDRKDVVEI